MPNRPRVFVVQPVQDEPLQALRDVADVEVFPAVDRYCDGAELLAGVREADYLFELGEVRLSADVLAAAPRLKLIAAMEIFPTAIDLAAATERGIPVAGLPHSSEITETTAEFTFALIGALSWRIPQAERFLRAGRWVQYQTTALPADRMRERSLGIVGLGAIGRGVARRAQAAGMRVMYTDRRPFDAVTESALGVVWRDLDDLFAEADIVVVCATLTRSTEGLVDARVLARMKPDALFVNTSRGRVVDESAVIDALVGKRIAGAALDVFTQERPDDPRPDPRLIELDNVILTPHIGTSARQTRTWMAQQVVTNILRHMRGERPHQILNPEVYGDSPLTHERIG